MLNLICLLAIGGSVFTAAYIINTLPTPVINDISPFRKLYNRVPDYNSFRVFGCIVFPYLRPYNKHKLQMRSAKCVFLGYSPSHKGYKCLSSSSRIYITRHAVFNEQEFLYKHLFRNGDYSAIESSPTVLPFSEIKWTATRIDGEVGEPAQGRVSSPTHTNDHSSTHVPITHIEPNFSPVHSTTSLPILVPHTTPKIPYQPALHPHVTKLPQIAIQFLPLLKTLLLPLVPNQHIL